MNTQNLMGLAMERSCQDPELWNAYWEQRELDGPTLRALVRRAAYATSHGNADAAAIAQVMFSVGFEAGKLAGDPVSHMEDEKRGLRFVVRQEGKWYVLDEDDRVMAGPFDTRSQAHVAETA